MSKQIKCADCWGLNGNHWPHCQTQGYMTTGPHPNAPAREADAPTPGGALEMCCGGTCVRALCFIHATEPRPTERAPAYEVEDSGGNGTPTAAQVASDWVRAHPTLGVAPADELRLLGPDDPEVSTDLIYATSTGGVVGVPQPWTQGLGTNCRCVLRPR